MSSSICKRMDCVGCGIFTRLSALSSKKIILELTWHYFVKSCESLMSTSTRFTQFIVHSLTVASEPRLDIYWQTKIKVEFWYFLTSTRSDSSCMTGIFWRWPLISLKKLVSKWLEKPCMNFNVKYQGLLEGFNPQFFLCTLRTFSPTWEMIQKLPKSPGYTVLAKSKFGTSPMGKVFSLES